MCSVTLPANVARSTLDLPDSVRDIGGFTAHRISDRHIKDLHVLERQKFIADSAELTAKMSECRQGNSCPPRLMGFIHLLDEANADANPMHKMIAVNSWVNLSLTYDKEEEKQPDNLHHRSLLQTLITGKGLCDEYALLKLYALRHSGWSETAAFWMGVSVYKKPLSFAILTRRAAGHAVAVAKIDHKFWVLDFFRNTYRFPTKNPVILSAGMVEQLSTYVGYSGQSFYSGTVKYPGHLLNDMSQYTLGTDAAKLHDNETMKRLPAFAHLPEDVLSAPRTVTVLAHPENFQSLDEAYTLNVPPSINPRTLRTSLRVLHHKN